MATDLDARIRVQLAGWRLNVESLREHGMDLIALDALMQAQAALLVVLDRHKPNAHPSGLGPYCETCVGGYEGVSEWPCATVKDVAKELGIEVPDA